MVSVSMSSACILVHFEIALLLGILILVKQCLSALLPEAISTSALARH